MKAKRVTGRRVWPVIFKVAMLIVRTLSFSLCFWSQRTRIRGRSGHQSHRKPAQQPLRVRGVRTRLAEDLQLPFLLLTSGQSGELLQQHGAGRGGDVQEVLEGLGDGAGRDPRLIGPVTYHT